MFKKLGFSGDYMNGRFFEANIMYRQHHNKIVVKIMNDWWWWIKHYSYRDQFSLTYVLWKHNVSVPLLADRTYREGNMVKYNLGENHITLSEAKTQIARSSQNLAERDAQIVMLNQNIVERDAQIVNLNQNIAALSTDIVTMRGVIEEKDKIINSLLASRSWGVTRPLRRADAVIRNLRYLVVASAQRIRCCAVAAIKNTDYKLCIYLFRYLFKGTDPYKHWLNINTGVATDLVNLALLRHI
jgi:hypothetical protein